MTNDQPTTTREIATLSDEDGRTIYVDTATGEELDPLLLFEQSDLLIKKEVAAMSVEEERSHLDAGMKLVWRIARTIRAIRASVDPDSDRYALKALDSEITRLMAVRDLAVEKAQKADAILLAQSEYLMRALNAEKYKLDGVGHFRFRKMPDRLTPKAQGPGKLFEGIPDAQLEQWHLKYPELIRKSITYSPDAAAIKKVLVEGLPAGMNTNDHPAFELFTLTAQDSKFEFAVK